MVGKGQGTIIFCARCGARCKVAGPGRAEARMLRLAKEAKGLCVNCATHDWLRNTYPINMLLAEKGPGSLALPHTREQFANIMRVAGADAQPDEINWNLINENWDLPFPHKIRPSATNPMSQKELDAITEFRKASPHLPREVRNTIQKTPLVIRTFEELDMIEPGLGSRMRRLLGGLDMDERPMTEEERPMQFDFEGFRRGVDAAQISPAYEAERKRIMGKKKEENELIHRSTEPRDLACKLSAKQKAAAAEELAETIQRIDALADEKKTATKEFAERNQRLVAELRALGRQVKDGTAIRSVPCELALNYNTLTATVTRKDTGEQVEERPMTEEEKQMQLDFDGD